MRAYQLVILDRALVIASIGSQRNKSRPKVARIIYSTGRRLQPGEGAIDIHARWCVARMMRRKMYDR